MNIKNFEDTDPIGFVSNYCLADVCPIIYDIEKSRGSIFVDKLTGRNYLDCFGFFASSALGHNHPSLFEQEFEQKLLKVSRVKPSNSDFYTEEFVEFIECFTAIAKPKEFKNLFFIDGGALAVENALKVAFDWKSKLNALKGINVEAGNVIHFENAFHGRSGYTLSLTNTGNKAITDLFPKHKWPRFKTPTINFPMDDQENVRLDNLEEKVQNDIESLLVEHGDEICAIIIEPVQGEGGDNYFRERFHHILRKLADAFDVLLIYDEVQTGLGTTGKLWGYQHYNIVPDIVCFGKKTQVSGIMATERVDQVKNNVFKISSRINSTWGGSLTDMVRVSKIFKVIQEENLIENAHNIGKLALDEIIKLSGDQNNILKNIRGKGMMFAFDLESTPERDRLFNSLFENGVLAIKSGDKGIRFRPALNFSQEDLYLLVQKIQEAI